MMHKLKNVSTWLLLILVAVLVFSLVRQGNSLDEARDYSSSNLELAVESHDLYLQHHKRVHDLWEISGSYYLNDPEGYLDQGLVFLEDYGEFLASGRVRVPGPGTIGQDVFAQYKFENPPVLESPDGDTLTVPMSKGSVVTLSKSGDFLELSICPVITQKCFPSFFQTALFVPEEPAQETLQKQNAN